MMIWTWYHTQIQYVAFAMAWAWTLKKLSKKYSMSPSARGTVKSSHKKIQYAVSATLGQCPSDINKLFPMFTIESQNVISHRYWKGINGHGLTWNELFRLNYKDEVLRLFLCMDASERAKTETLCWSWWLKTAKNK